MSYTETPWEYIITGRDEAKICGSRGQEIAFRLYEPNAEFIVRACNAYDVMLEALEGMVNCPTYRYPYTHERMAAIQAIAKAKGEK
jgi:hypothetical protein